MSRSIGSEIPEFFRNAIDLAEPIDLAMSLATVGSDNFPHISMLSWGEMILGHGGLWISMWPSSRSTLNATQSGKATLSLVLDGHALTARLRLERGKDLNLESGARLACFRAAIDEMREDSVPYATLLSGIRFAANKPAELQSKWLEKREELRRRSLGAAGPQTN